MATLIFATETDASPLIVLDAPAEDVRRYLADHIHPPDSAARVDRLMYDDPMPCGLAAILFLRGLSPDQFDDWAPAIESAPIMSAEDVADFSNGDHRWIVWNPVTWREWPLDAEGGAALMPALGGVVGFGENTP